jgi:hypothetical protein
MLQLDFTQWKAQVCDNYILLSERLKYFTIRFYSVKGSSMLQLNLLCERLKYVSIRFDTVKDSSMLQLDFTHWKPEVCDNNILLREKLKYATFRFYSVKGSSMRQLNFAQ